MSRHPVLTEEHHDFYDSFVSWVRAEMYPHRFQWEETTWPKELLTRMGELGYLGLTYPEEWGGQGGDFYYSLVRAEALSYSLSGGTNMGILVHTDMATPPVHVLGTDEQKEEFLRPAISGEKLSCLGISEPGAGSDVAAIRTRARRDGDDFIVNGEKVFITNGIKADWCLLVVRTGAEGAHEDISLLLVPLREIGESYQSQEEDLGPEIRDIERLVLLGVIDSKWREHLYDMDYLREGIHLRSFAQIEPLVAYKNEGFLLFEELVRDIFFQATEVLFHVEREDEEALLKESSPEDLVVYEEDLKKEAAKTLPARKKGEKIGRNDPCPCGSGKKYKKCHGA